MRILLINTNQALRPYPVFPIGVCSVALALETKGHEVSVLDLCFEKDTETPIRERVLSFRPDLVGVGIRNLDNSDLIDFQWFLPAVRKMIDQVRRATDSRIVLGGAAVSVLPKAVLEFMDCDLGVIGDGEAAFAGLAEALDKRKPYWSVPGTVGKIDGRWFANPKNPVTEYDLYGQSRIHRWIPTREYIAQGSIFPVQSNRGCAFDCIYCTYAQIEGKKYRLRPGELVAEEIAEARTRGIDYFEFVDSVFNVPESHARSVCREIIRRGLKARFGAAGINPKWLTDELLDLMEEAGFESLDITVESASASMLRNLRKGFGHADVIAAARRLARRKFKVLWIFLLGGPGENQFTLRESLNFMSEYIRPRDYAYLTLGLRIYPDTPLAAMALRDGAFESQEELIHPAFYISEQLNLLQAYFQIEEFRRNRPNVLASYETGHPLLPLVYSFLRAVNAKKPYWRYARYFSVLKAWGGERLSGLPAKLSRLTERSGNYFLPQEIPA